VLQCSASPPLAPAVSHVCSHCASQYAGGVCVCMCACERERVKKDITRGGARGRTPSTLVEPSRPCLVLPASVLVRNTHSVNRV